MKIASLVGLGALLAAVSMSSAFAQTARPYDQSGPLTRAQVRADLADWRAAGYDPRHVDFRAFPRRPLGRQRKPEPALQRGSHREHSQIGGGEFGQRPAKFSDWGAHRRNDINSSIHIGCPNFITRSAIALIVEPMKANFISSRNSRWFSAPSANALKVSCFHSCMT